MRYTEEGDPATGINGKAASFNFGVGVGIGFSYKRMFEVSGRYDIGLTNTYKGQMKEQTNDPNVSKKKSEQVLSVGLSYIFQSKFLNYKLNPVKVILTGFIFI